ncbi:MAG: M50 family metallopeptidase [Verrucomicrobiales bacterium]
MSEFESGEPPDRGPKTKNEWGILVIVSFFFGLFLVLEIAREFTVAKLSIPFFLVSWVVLLIVHECGHALAAWMLGWRIRLVSIGTGKVRFALHLRDVPIEFRTIPLSGFVQPQPTDLVAPRTKQFVIYAAGPGIELIAVGLAVWWFGAAELLQRTPDAGMIAVQSYCVAAILGAGMNLIPFSHRTAEGTGWSDGLGMLLCWRIPDEVFQRRIDEA